MTLLGKILALVNVLAAIGFIYLAASDYGKRKQWSYAVYRQELVMDGLPLDDKETDVDGVPRVKNLTQPTLTEIFQQGGGSPVNTQLDEVKRVQALLSGRANSSDPLTVPDPLNPQAQLTLATPAQKRAFFLLPLARAFMPAPPTEGVAPESQPIPPLDRTTLIAQMKAPGEKPDEATFNKAFDDVLALPDPGDKRRAIAELLFGLTESLAAADGQQGDLFESPAYKRYLAVVGSRAAVQALDSEAAALTRLAQEADEVLVANRTAFAALDGRLLSRVRDMDDQVQRAKDALEAQKNQVARQQDLVGERERQVKELESRLAAARKATGEELSKQSKLQEAVLAAQRKLRDANQKNQELRREILKLEETR